MTIERNGDDTRQDANRISRQVIVELLLPYVITRQERRDLVTASWGPQTKLQYEIDYDGSPVQFTEQFVTKTLKFGRSLGDRDTSAIELVLDYLRHLSGYEQQVLIDRLIADLRDEDQALLRMPSPYMGLEPYGEIDEGIFFGRTAITEKLLTRIYSWDLDPHANRFLAIIGASGSGKSSLVKAGLLPKIRKRKNWRLISTQPSESPLFDLAVNFVPPNESLQRLKEQLLNDKRTLYRTIKQRLVQDWSDEEGVLLYLDQFEQLFTFKQTSDEAKKKKKARGERQAFVDNLLFATGTPGGPLRLILTMRADFYHRAADYDNLRAMLTEHQEYIGTMNVDELVEIVEKPAELLGYRLEDGLTEVIIDDLDTRDGRPQPGTLPLLSHALREAWEVRSAATLHLSDYIAIGGVKGALRNKADEVYGGLQPGEQELARALFLRLTHLGEGTEDTRRRIALSDLEIPGIEQENLKRVRRKLVNARLLVVGGDAVSDAETLQPAQPLGDHTFAQTELPERENGRHVYVEVAHEALIREWQQLRTWLNENRVDLQVQHRLTERAGQWQEMNRDSSYLYKGSELAVAEKLTDKPGIYLTKREQEFIQASLRQRRTRRNRLRIAFVAVLATTIIMTLLAFGLWRASRVSLSRQLSAQALEFAGQESDLALLLSLAAYEIDDNPEARRSLLGSILASPHLQTFLHGHDRAVNAVIYSPDNQLIVSAGDDGEVRFWNAGTYELLDEPLQGHPNGVLDLAINDDETLIASAGRAGKVVIWDPDSRQPQGNAINIGTSAVNGVAFVPGDESLVTVGDDGRLLLWDVANRQLLAEESTDPKIALRSIAVSSDGRLLAAGNEDGTIFLWDLRASELTRREFSLPAQEAGAIFDLDFHPNDKTLAASGNGKVLLLWDTESGGQLGKARDEHHAFVYSVAFSGDGEKLVSSAENGTIIVWKVSAPDLIPIPGIPSQPLSEPLFLTGRSSAVRSSLFDPRNADQLFSAGWDGKVAVWSLDAPDPLGNVLADPATGFQWRQWSLAMSADENWIVVGRCNQARGWDTFDHCNSGTVRIFDRQSGRFLDFPDLMDLGGGTRGLAISADNILAYVTCAHIDLASHRCAEPEIHLWDLNRQESFGVPLRGHADWILTLAFDPAGKHLASAAADGGIIVWDVDTKIPLSEISNAHERGVWALAFNSMGDMLASSGEDGKVRLWTADDLQSIGSTGAWHTDRVWALAFHPEMNLLASGGQDNQIFLWEIDSEVSQIARLSKHERAVNQLAFTPDGRWLVSADGDAKIMLWELSTGQSMGEFVIAGAQGITGLALQRQGEMLIAGSSDGKMISWSLAIEEWQRRACEMANRPLEPRERDLYIGLLGFFVNPCAIES